MEPNVVIIGRPNVGKSSLLNALVGYRRAIVWDEPGTTLDDVTERLTWNEKPFLLVDSQGIFSEADEPVLKRLIERGDVFVFVVDGISGPTPFDRWIAGFVKAAHKRVLLCVNKIEAKESFSETDFAELGFDETLSVSAAHRFNFTTLKTWIEGAVAGLVSGESDVEVEVIRQTAVTEGEAPLSIAFIGRPNTGKSTLMNLLCGKQVSRVSPLPLTTRDSVGFEMQTPAGRVRLIDTAGMRRPRSEKGSIEIFSVQASTRAMRDADVVFLLIGSPEGVTDQDVRLLNLIVNEGRPTAVLLNFWDLLSSTERKNFLDGTDFKSYLSQFHLLPISGLKGFNTKEILPLAFRMYKQAQKRVKTSRLNEVVEKIIASNPPPTAGRQNFNILYASQVRVDPPTFVFFMNRQGSIPESYRVYMEKQLKKKLGFKGQSIRVLFRGGKTRPKPGWVKPREKMF
jgi:GTPase